MSAFRPNAESYKEDNWHPKGDEDSKPQMPCGKEPGPYDEPPESEENSPNTGLSSP
jgi:hypothetical protein